ncbi:hypothetical protein ACFL35_17330 [Candidatus Riflebacteria bacterium]
MPNHEIFGANLLAHNHVDPQEADTSTSRQFISFNCPLPDLKKLFATGSLNCMKLVMAIVFQVKVRKNKDRVAVISKELTDKFDLKSSCSRDALRRLVKAGLVKVLASGSGKKTIVQLTF